MLLTLDRTQLLSSGKYLKTDELFLGTDYVLEWTYLQGTISVQYARNIKTGLSISRNWPYHADRDKNSLSRAMIGQ